MFTSSRGARNGSSVSSRLAFTQLSVGVAGNARARPKQMQKKSFTNTSALAPSASGHGLGSAARAGGGISASSSSPIAACEQRSSSWRRGAQSSYGTAGSLSDFTALRRCTTRPSRRADRAAEADHVAALRLLGRGGRLRRERQRLLALLVRVSRALDQAAEPAPVRPSAASAFRWWSSGPARGGSCNSASARASGVTPPSGSAASPRGAARAAAG